VAWRRTTYVTARAVTLPGSCASLQLLHVASLRTQDLTAHCCINLRLPTRGVLYAWEFKKGGREVNVRVEGQTTFNSTALILEAALGGLGVVYLPEGRI